MTTQTIVAVLAKGFILLSSLSLLAVSIMAFHNPQSVMDLVHIQLTNTDAFSSIRGVYGGVGITLVLSLVYLLRHNVSYALAFLTLLWGAYALSRAITIFAEGALGSFGVRWLITESILCLLGGILYRLYVRRAIQ